MKYTIIAALFLAGCGVTPVKTVEVSKPIPYCPAPPEVVKCTFYVDQLTSADLTDPGKVAQAYKLDMTCLRANDLTLRKIIAAYQDISVKAEDVEKMLQEAGVEYTKASDLNATITSTITK